MLAILIPLIFVVAVAAAVGAIVATWSQCRDVALSNIAALRQVGQVREYRVVTAGIVCKPVLSGSLRRANVRGSAPRPSVRQPAACRAAA